MAAQANEVATLLSAARAPSHPATPRTMMARVLAPKIAKRAGHRPATEPASSNAAGNGGQTMGPST